MRKLLLFGGGGFVGGNIARLAMQNGWHVTIADSFYRPGLDGAEWLDVNITDRDAVAAVINEVRPDAAVNVAAVADIDKAERDRETARLVNVEGARYAAESCAAVGSRYIYFSSDAVFDGEGAGYREEDAKAPVNYYGVTKSEAEDAIFKAYPGAVVIRISLVIGFPVTGGNSFFDGLRNKLAEGAEVVCPVSEVRTPVDVLTLSECILELAEGSFTGIVHIGATDSINRYELTKKAAAAMGFDVNLVKAKVDETAAPVSAAPPVSTDASGGGAPIAAAPARAPRHKNGIICVEKAQKLFKAKMLTVDESVRRVIPPGFVP